MVVSGWHSLALPLIRLSELRSGQRKLTSLHQQLAAIDNLLPRKGNPLAINGNAWMAD